MNSPSLSRHAPSHSHSLQRYTYIPFHQNLSGCGVEMEVGMRLGGVRVLAIIIVVPLCSARYPKDPLHPSSLLSFWPGFWPCVSVKRSMAHLGAQTRGERTHLVKQLYPIAHRYSTHPHTHTRIRGLALFICVEISHLGVEPSPLPAPLWFLLNQSINVGQIALMCSESLAKSSYNGVAKGVLGVEVRKVVAHNNKNSSELKPDYSC